MSLCILAAGKTTVLAVSAFTLSWTHSIEKTRWEEDWRVTPAGLEIVEARVKGSAAGMEPPHDAVLKDGWWVYKLGLPVQREVVLAASGATGGGWTLCADRKCLELGREAGAAVELSVCVADSNPHRRRGSASPKSSSDQWEAAGVPNEAPLRRAQAGPGPRI